MSKNFEENIPGRERIFDAFWEKVISLCIFCCMKKDN